MAVGTGIARGMGTSLTGPMTAVSVPARLLASPAPLLVRLGVLTAALAGVALF